MPNLPTGPGMSLLSTAGENSGKSSAITPPPYHNRAVAENQSIVVVGMAGKKNDGGVTPSPVPPKVESKKAAAGKLGDADKPMSKATIEAHKKWQAEAEKLGGPGARVIVGKPDASRGF